MEGGNYVSNIPKPSTLPRPLLFTTTQQVQPSRLPTKFNLKVRRSRPDVVRNERQRLDLKDVTSQSEAHRQDESKRVDNSALAPDVVGASRTAPAMYTEPNAEAHAEAPDANLVTPAVKVPVTHRRPRPSLSERTIETLSQIPPSPSPRRRRSSIYPVDMPGSSLSRPPSSLLVSRPGTSTGQRPVPSTPGRLSPTKRQEKSMACSSLAKPTPTRRSVSSYIPKNPPRGSTADDGATGSVPSEVPLVPKLPPNTLGRSSNRGLTKPAVSLQGATSNGNGRTNVLGEVESGHEIGRHNAMKPKFGANTYAAKSARQRIPLDSLFSRQAPSNFNGQNNQGPPRKHRLSSTVPNKAKEPPRPASPTKAKSSRTLKDLHHTNAASTEDLSLINSNSPKSSAALRETIAKAKEARRLAAKLERHPNSVLTKNPPIVKNGKDGFLPDVHDESVLQKRMNVARTSGRLNIAALGLAEFPNGLQKMYNIDDIDINSGEWYESVDLVRVNAADNEFESLPEWAFPDISIESTIDVDEVQFGNIFGGLESIDLHGNNLKELPCGLRRLSRLRNINLSRNRLVNACVDILSQIPSLKELRLAGNALDGSLNESVGNLTSLEVLDLQDNTISDLGPAFRYLNRLRNLAVAGNRLTSIPFQILESLPLTEIYAARNRLVGALIPEGIEDLAALKTLDVSNNALTAISKCETLALLSLEELNVADNRLCTIPDISGWTSMITLSAGGNKLTTIPEGVTSLPTLKSLDLSRNSIKQLDNRLGLMESLTCLEVGNNPLRERRCLNMNTDELKEELRGRLPPPPELGTHSDEIFLNGVISIDAAASSTREIIWPTKPGGVLDRSSTNLCAIEASHLEPILETTEIRSLVLHHNHLSSIPSVLSLAQNTLTTLDLSHNHLTNETYLPTPLSLPYLRSLDLSANTISSTSPLISSLDAPLLSLLNVSFNRLPSLPTLRATYPSLTTVLASNNNISALEVDTAKGLHVLDVSGNAIERLEPRLGLLATQGLRTLLVGGNRFRVPRREILEKGTDTVLGWLRGRIPVGEAEEGGMVEES